MPVPAPVRFGVPGASVHAFASAMSDIDANQVNVPGYRLVRPLGSGGAATVYVAMQRSLERQVAVKVFDTTDVASIARFEQLLRTIARLSHPYVADIHQIGHTDDGRLFHSMPFRLSADLSRHNLRAKPLRVAALLRQVLDAVEYAHRRGIVHGGIKPTNVLFDERGAVRLADFGIARCAAELGRPHPRAAAYLAPEQARGHPPGQRSDLYSIGVMAFELLTGHLPFEGEDAVATAVAHIEQPVPRLPPMVGAWQDWIDKALAKAPEQRFQSAAEMAAGLAALDGRTGVTATAPRLRGAHRPAWAIGATAAVVAVAALATWGGWRHAHRTRPPAAMAVPTEPVVASVPASGPLPVPATSSPLAGRVQVLLAQAEALRTGGHLFAPPGNNAAEQYLAVLVLDPGNGTAVDGIDAMLVTLHDRLDAAWRDNQLTQAGLLVKQCDLLARHAGPRASRTWRAQRAAFAKRVGDGVAAAVHARDLKRLAALKPLAEALPAAYPAGFDLAAAERAAATPVAGDTLRDPGGPVLVYVPAAGSAPAFAIARVEVTRADYAAFAQATHRPDARCAEAYNPFSRLRRLTWQAPGFAQDGNHPVVCVSWDDATAYAAWLSKTTGQPYVLPGSGQWLRAAQGMPKEGPCQLGNVDDVSRKSAMDNDKLSCSDGAEYTAAVGHYAPSGVGAFDMYGNVSEWLAGGSTGSRMFRGLSWRDGSRQTPLGRQGTAGTDVGYTNVGFRVMRVIDPAHAAPPAAPGH